jgi:hypothetical protein
MPTYCDCADRAHPTVKCGGDLCHCHEPVIYTTGLEDMARLIAQETSGLVDAVPDELDFELARVFINRINCRFD